MTAVKATKKPNGGLALPVGKGVYAITPDTDDTAWLLRQTASALRAGVLAVQYRHKTAPAALRLTQARQLATLCRSHAVPLLINDHWDVALEVGAQGVHLGQDDLGVEQARQQLPPGTWVGASCYGSWSRALDMHAQGADYLAFGSFHPSRTKPTAMPADAAILERARALGVPVVAIGGIEPANAQPLLRAGADWLAVCHCVFAAPEPGAVIRRFQELIAREVVDEQP